MASKELKRPVVKYLEDTGVADGGTFSGEWTFDDDYNLRHIFIKADGAAPTKSTVTVRIDGDVITKDKCLANTFGTNAENALLLNYPVKKSQKIKIEGTNNEGATKDFTMELVLERA